MIGITGKEYLLDAVLEYCEDIVTVKDLSLRYLACNKAFCKLIGYKDDKNILGKKLRDVIPFNCVGILEECSKKVIQTQEIQSITFVCSHNKIIKQPLQFALCILSLVVRFLHLKI